MVPFKVFEVVFAGGTVLVVVRRKIGVDCYLNWVDFDQHADGELAHFNHSPPVVQRLTSMACKKK